MNNRILIIDGNSIAYRAYYATAFKGDLLETSLGQPMNAVYTFHNMILSAINIIKPTHLFIAFDAGKKTKRHDILGDYKGGRKRTPDELISQFPIIKQMLDAMGIARYEVDGMEADDIIGTLAKKADKENFEVKVMSSDKDLLQLVHGNIEILLNRSGTKNLFKVNKDNFFENYGIHPNQIPDFKGISGDPSDNLKGVKGIGEKGAIKLLNKYNTLESIYEHVSEQTEGVQKKLNESKEMAFICKEIATLVCDMEIPHSFDGCKFKIEATDETLNFFYRHEMKSLINKYEKYYK